MSSDHSVLPPSPASDGKDALMAAEEERLVPADEPLPYDMAVSRTAPSRPILLDLLLVVKRHRLIFGFYVRLILIMPDGIEVPGQRYFDYHSVPVLSENDHLDADRLFHCQHNIDDHLRRCRELTRSYPESYFRSSYQAGQVLEASAREVERLHAAILTARTDDWPQRKAVAAIVRLVRPDFLDGEEWTSTSKVSSQYPAMLQEQIAYLAGISLTEREGSGGISAPQGDEQATPPQNRPSRRGSKGLQPPANPAQDTRKIVPSSDYRFVQWGKERFSFTPLQAAIVKLLHAEYERKVGLGLSESTIVECVRSEAVKPRVDHWFRGKGNKPHPAWMTMIVKSSKGTYCLAEPNHQ